MIIFIDDEARRVDSYVEACEFAGFEAKIFENPAEGVDAIVKMASPPQALVLDVMLPIGERFDADATLEGLRTGIEIFKTVRKQWPALPVLFLTQARDPLVGEVAAADGRARVAIKPDLLASSLPNLLKEFIAAAKKA